MTALPLTVPLQCEREVSVLWPIELLSLLRRKELVKMCVLWALWYHAAGGITEVPYSPDPQSYFQEHVKVSESVWE